MNSLEEKLWEYIDGTGTAAQRAETAQLITTNVHIRQQYEELLQLHADFGQLELDEPPMAFTYNVMEHIRAEKAIVPLKAGINRRVVWSIAGFFIITLSVALIAMLTQINWQSAPNNGFEMPKLPVAIGNEQVEGLFSGPLMRVFVFVDVVAGLFLFDSWLRRRRGVQRGASSF